MAGCKNITVPTMVLLWVSMCLGGVHGANFDVRHYGTRADGRSDDSGAMMNAWKDACASDAGPVTTFTIPPGNYLVGSLNFQGPCKASSMNVQLQGTLVAPSDLNKVKSQGAWVIFQNIDWLTVSGGGTLDGQGAVAWSKNGCQRGGMCGSFPSNLEFSSITNGFIEDITSLNSKLFHIELINCKNVTLQQLTINAPGNSLNTDGIHIGRSTGINITGIDIKTGDDCISFGDGSQQVYVSGVTCGPGHGISVGSLGKFQGEQPVTGLTVKNCTLTNTMNGVRVKTWPASISSLASNLHFEDIKMMNVGTPILIDQQYCPYGRCQLKACSEHAILPPSIHSHTEKFEFLFQVPSRVKLSDIFFTRIQGTSSTPVTVKLACSAEVPCQNVQVSDINLRYDGNDGNSTSLCSNIKPRTSGLLFPTLCTGEVPAP
ncbi:hypothetical protein MLD38_019934 [Melastoma candidum]|uniref:Uncharacterized protein n=1 Tax=Melastoma candidum TaxID=119954 RepID=A0ACB9QCN2_9MYRT|nr:hypothetical protein MLD38_019934 [Melastoma candidum]